MKNKLMLMLTALFVTQTIQPNGGGGSFGAGFAGGVIGAAIVGNAIANRGPKAPEYYEAQDRSARRSVIRRQIRDSQKNLRAASKRGDMDEVNRRKVEINGLQEELRSI